MDILRLYIYIKETKELVTDSSTIRMVLFDGECKGDYFSGRILDGGVDTQMVGADGVGTLSARYMLEGYDCQNQPCRLYIENNAVTGQGNVITKPIIHTDSKALKWLEQKPLLGRMEEEKGLLVIVIYTEKG